MLRQLTRCSLWRPSRALTASALPKWMPRIAGQSFQQRSMVQPIGSLFQMSRRRMATDAASEKAPAAPAAPAPWAMDEAVPLTEEKGLLGRGYEWYPVIGFSLFTTISQEWFAVDESWSLGAVYGLAMFTMWNGMRDWVEAKHKKQWDQKVNMVKSGFGIRLDFLEGYKALESFATGHADDLRAMYAEEKEINRRAVEYVNLKNRADTTALVQARLKLIASLEQDTRSRAIAALSASAVQYVEQKYRALPDSTKSKVVDDAINKITPTMSSEWMWATTRNPPPLPKAGDPVKTLFDDFLSQTRTIEQLGVRDSVASLLNREAAAAAKAKEANKAKPAPAAAH